MAGVRLYTARVSYGGPDRLDVTAKGRDPIGRVFAPSWAILGPALAKRGKGALTDDDWAAYVTAYTAEMRRSYREHRAAWDEVLGREETTVVCFCTSATQCHRHTLASIFGKLGAQVMGERPPTPRVAR